MERVAFLVERTGARISAMINPDELVIRRRAGLSPRDRRLGPLAGAALSDDPLLYAGGGCTELTMNLLFDVALGIPPNAEDDVRRLSGPLWDLAETPQGGFGAGEPPFVRFVWGKAWNMPGLVSGIAERLERFGPGGTPRRSWMRLRLTRVDPRGIAHAVPEARPTQSLASAPGPSAAATTTTGEAPV